MSRARILAGILLFWASVSCGGLDWDSYKGRKIMMPIFPDVTGAELELYGKVTDAQPGSPIPAAQVLLYHLSNPSTREDLRSVETDKNGLYSLSFSGEVKRKFVYLTVSKTGYATEEKWIKALYTPEGQVFDFQMEKSGDCGGD